MLVFRGLFFASLTHLTMSVCESQPCSVCVGKDCMYNPSADLSARERKFGVLSGSLAMGCNGSKTEGTPPGTSGATRGSILSSARVGIG